MRTRGRGSKNPKLLWTSYLEAPLCRLVVEQPLDPVRQLGDARQAAAQLRQRAAQVGEQAEVGLVQQVVVLPRRLGILLL